MKDIRVRRTAVLVLIGIGLLCGCGEDGAAGSRSTKVVAGKKVDSAVLTTFSNPRSAHGELVYVPIYSSVFHQTADREYLMTATLSIHNIDLTETIQVSTVSYFDTDGGPVREFLSEPIILEPLATRQFIVPEKDRSGGSGANFLVKWESETDASRPLIEAVMISTSGQQGISFTSQGAVVRELR